MSRSRPLVNGLSPQIVSPGCKITIRGERMGANVSDIVALIICGEDCKPFIEYCSENKIVSYVGKNPQRDRPYVIVVTLSGGEGECSIELRVTDRPERVSLEHEVPLWMDENQLEIENVARDRATSQGDPRNLFGGHVSFQPTQKTPECDPSSVSFDPVKYLLNHHKDASVAELQTGMAFLREECGGHTNSDIEFVRNHVDVLLSCYETLEQVNQSIEEEETKTTGGNLTTPLDVVVKECNRRAAELFSSILDKKDKADRIRNALNVIDRFRFLFGLPDSIDKNIANKAYDIVLNDYKKAKSLFADTQVRVFQQVMEGVNSKITAFTAQLEERLLDPKCPLNEKKQLLKYLVEFKGTPTNDPAWENLETQQRQIIDFLIKDKRGFKNRVQEFVEREKNLQKMKLAGRSNHSENSISPLVNQFVDELCDRVTLSLSDYWALCQTYLEGSLLPEVKNKPVFQHQDSFLSPPSTPGTTTPAGNRFEDHTEDIRGLIMEVIKLFTGILTQYCIDKDFQFNLPNHSKDSEHALYLMNKGQPAWAAATVKRVRICTEQLLSMGIPHECVAASVELVTVMRRICVRCLFKSSEQNITELHVRENWQLSQERGHTALPLHFQNTVLGLLSTVREVMEDIRFTRGTDAALVKEIQTMFCSVVVAFADCLKKLTDVGDDGKDMHDTTVPSTLDEHAANTTAEERLVLVLGNCRHTMLTVIPLLLETFKSHGYIKGSDDEIENKSIERYSTLERSIFDKYVNSKESFLFGDIEQFLQPKSFPWAECNPPSSVNIYVQELALKLVMAQSELHNIEAELLKRIIGHLLEKVTHRVCGMMTGIEKISKNGSLQARLDLESCLLLFRGNMNSKCRRLVQETIDGLPSGDITPEDLAELAILLERFKTHNQILVSCLDYSPKSDKAFSPGGGGDSLKKRLSLKRKPKGKMVRSPGATNS